MICTKLITSFGRSKPITGKSFRPYGMEYRFPPLLKCTEIHCPELTEGVSPVGLTEN